MAPMPAPVPVRADVKALRVKYGLCGRCSLRKDSRVHDLDYYPPPDPYAHPRCAWTDPADLVVVADDAA